MSKLLLAVGIVAFVAFMFIGKIDKKVDNETRATNLQVQQVIDSVNIERKKIVTGDINATDPVVEARMVERQKELDEIERNRKKDRAKDDKRVQDTDKVADDLDALEAKNK